MPRPEFNRKILKEVKEINDNGAPLGIYAHLDQDDTNSLKILLIGPEDSPYYGGFFLFTVKFPDQFPFVPPLVNFVTPKRHSGCRVHPNLYQEGKVCLSMLNTWGGKEWSPVLTLEKIFLTIQGLLDDNPITNEPGHENVKKTSKEGRDYYLVALNRTLRVGVLEMFTHPDLPAPFLEIMKRNVKENGKKYLEQVEILKDVDEKTVNCFHGSEKVNYQKLKNDLVLLVQSV